MKSPLTGWLGGKNRLAKRIAGLMPPHEHYVEVFGGSGAVLFVKEPSPLETYNDINGELVNFFRVMRDDYEGFLHEARYALHSREIFEDYRDHVEPEKLAPAARAWRFFYLQKCGFAGRGCVWGYRVKSKMRPLATRISPDRIRPVVEAAWRRLRYVQIERKSWQDILRRYDRPGTLFYLDPPYWDYERDYGEGIFHQSDFPAMADILGKIQGKFLLSLSDCPQTRATFGQFFALPVTACYSCNSRYTQRASELVIANFQAPGMSPLGEIPPLAEDKTLPEAERQPARLSRTPHIYLSGTQA